VCELLKNHPELVAPDVEVTVRAVGERSKMDARIKELSRRYSQGVLREGSQGEATNKSWRLPKMYKPKPRLDRARSFRRIALR